MESIKINQSKLEEYAERFAAKACDSFYSMFKTTVKGSEIMKISPVDQINYFVLFNLFEKWRQEVSKIESPYFDYTHNEVKDALKNFMNTLSMHINVKREELEPLLKNAVINTVNLTAMPKLFVSNFFNNLQETITIEQLSSYEKYFKIHKSLFSDTLVKVKELDKEEISKTYLLNKFNETHPSFIYDKKMEENTYYLLNTVIQTNFDEFQTIDNIGQNIAKEAAIPNSVVATETEDKATIDITELKKENFKPQTHHQISNRIVDTKSAMTINQRFMFVEQLFKGEKWEFDNALVKLDICDSYDSAVKMLLSEYALKYEWDTENEQVAELFDFIGKKYSN